MSSTSQFGSQGGVEDLKGKAKQTFDDASERIRDATGDARQQVQEVAGNVRSALDKSAREQPITTLLMAAAVGFVIGAVWKS